MDKNWHPNKNIVKTADVVENHKWWAIIFSTSFIWSYAPFLFISKLKCYSFSCHSWEIIEIDSFSVFAIKGLRSAKQEGSRFVYWSSLALLNSLVLNPAPSHNHDGLISRSIEAACSGSLLQSNLNSADVSPPSLQIALMCAVHFFFQVLKCSWLEGFNSAARDCFVALPAPFLYAP